jgi:hypothetical protein
MFLNRIASTAARSWARPTVASRGMTTVQDALTANDAAQLSGYNDIDYIIKEDAPVLEAVQKFAAYNIGCLVTTDAAGRFLSSAKSSYLISCWSFSRFLTFPCVGFLFIVIICVFGYRKSEWRDQ